MATDIFISYRRSDAAGHARLLQKDLAQFFGAERLFFDRASIESGADFPSTLSDAVREAKVLLAVIGPQWLEAADKSGKRRLDQPDDFVRKEIAQGLKQGKKVIPVLLEDAPMPAASDMPEELRPLASRDAHTLRGKSYEYDRQLAELVRLIAATPGVAQPRRLTEGLQERPFRGSDQVLSPHFSGRGAELAQIHDAFEGDAAARPKAVALWGQGGVGKTQVAMRYAQDHAYHYAGVWWFRAHSPELLDEDFTALVHACEVPKTDEREPAREAMQRWLSRQPPWLLVFDNAEEDSAIRDSLPRQGPHHSLITSRSPMWSGLAIPVEVMPWDEARAHEFLRQRLSGEMQSLHSALAESLGGLPLALEQAAAYCEEAGIDLGGYLQRLEKAGAKLLAKGKAATGYPDSIARTVSLAFERLAPATAQLMQHLAWFAPELVPDALFRGRPDFLPEPLRGATADELDFDDLVSELRKLGLAERVAATGDRASGSALRLHRLTRAVVRDLHSDPAAVVPVIVALIDAACPEGQDPGLWPQWAALMPHLIDPVLDAAATRAAAVTWARVQKALELYRTAGRHALVQHLMDRLKRQDHQLDAENSDKVTNMNSSAVELASGRALEEQVLAACRRLRGDEHPDTLRSMATLATMLRAQDDLDGARALQEQLLAVHRRLFGDEHLDTLRCTLDLADTLRAQGDLADASALYKRVLAIRGASSDAPDDLSPRGMPSLAIAARRSLPKVRA